METIFQRYASPRSPRLAPKPAGIKSGLAKSYCRIQMRHVYLALICLSLCASCAAPAPRVVEVPVYQCYSKPELLAATPEPPMQDETVGQLLEEAQALRQALRACNQDKKAIQALIDRQKPARPSPTP